jgi:hypothetical protein
MNRFLIVFALVFGALTAAALALAQPPPVTPTPVAKVALYTPDSSVKFAAADLATVPPEERPFIRYLSLYNVSKHYRRKVAETVSFVVNSLGTRRQMYIPLFVGDSDETVIRLNIYHYEWKAETWDDLARKGSGPKPQPDPYFHAFIDKLVAGEPVKKKVQKTVTKTKMVFTGYYDHYRQPIYRNQEVTETVEVEEEVPGEAVKKRILVGAPWVDPNAYAYLVKETQSESPILRADWFIVNATLPPAYYDFLRLGKNIKDFEALIFVDPKLAEKARSQDKGVVITSTVARNNRTLLRSPTFTGGYYWVSHDSLNSVDDRQYILNLLREKFDATEDIGTLPNGLQAYFLTNGQGNRLDFADPNVAIDNTAVDRVVRNGRSCIVCHAEGIKPIQDEVRTLTKKLRNAEQVKLLIADKNDAFKIADLFGTDLDEQIVKDQNLYFAAVARSNGLRADVNAQQYAKIYDDYYEVLLTKEVAALDLGIPVVDLERYIRLSNDPTVLALIREPIGPLRRDQWERSIQGIFLIIIAQRHGLVPAPNQPVVIPK